MKMLEHLPTAAGFFHKHHQTVRSSVDDVTLKNFTNLEEDHIRVSFVASIPQVREFNEGLKILRDDTRHATASGKKDERRARILKDDGNAAVQKGDWVKALDLYTKSYIFMPSENKSEVAIVLANRSAALYHLKQYEHSLRDIALSLSLGYPRDIQFKILDRRARCYLALKWNSDGIMAFRETISALDDAKLPKEKRQKMQTDAQLMMEILNKSIQMTKPKTEQPNVVSQNGSLIKKDPVPPQVSGKNNKIYTSASEALAIESNEDEGRFARANRDITVGEIMVSEKAHCGVLLGEHSSTHCQHCFERCLTPFACPTCSNVVFCSKECQKKGLDSYHTYECPILRLIWDSGCSITCHMALRIITQRPLVHFLDLKPKLDEEIKGKYMSNDYRCVYNLVRHETRRSKADFFQRTHMAVFLLSLLKKTSYFNLLNGETSTAVTDIKISEPKLNDIEAYIGGLILRNLQVLQFNAHEIFEIQCDRPTDVSGHVKKDSGKSIFLGGGIYPTLALFNHSCDPGVVRYFQGTSVIVQAIKNIKKGQQISENYGPIFTRKNIEERRSDLRDQYWFDCRCVACQQQWPMFEDMDEGIMRFKCDAESDCPNVIAVPTDCQEFMVQCGLCQKFTNILKGLKALQDTESAQKIAKHLMEKGDYGKALLKFIEELKLYDETLAPPFKDYHLCQQNIRRCLLTYGNISII